MSNETPLVTGYYRCTHILFKVSPAPADALPVEYVEAVKAILSASALFEPQHPFNTDGGDGLHTFRGTFHTGESRYLFSSAQIDYLRYWLHGMKLTDQFIPLLSSEYLFTASQLVKVESVVFPTMKSLRDATKKVKRMNKRLESCDTSLVAWRNTFERVRHFWAANTGVWCALDFESWTRDHTLITEFGFSSIHWSDGTEQRDSGHFTVKEHRAFRNGEYQVPERREFYNFQEFGVGESVEVTKAGLKAKISNLISGMHVHGPVYLVFHDQRGDMKTLDGLRAPVQKAATRLPDTVPTEGVFILDTQVLFGALIGKSHNREKLERICVQLGIQPSNLHNAGNDAYYTLDALREMASGEPLDAQAERRWPRWTPEVGDTSGLAIQLPEEDSDS
ncbi:hypothetical protein C8R47DRAFT_1156257 [Mycena vitilis]|nr:hypothetical protein C8R47DRAFT_1156257 [Mycena vitilis]